VIAIVKYDQQQVHGIRGGLDLVGDLNVGPVRGQDLAAQGVDDIVRRAGVITQAATDLIRAAVDGKHIVQQPVRALKSGPVPYGIMDDGQNFVKAVDAQKIEDLASHGPVFSFQKLVISQGGYPLPCLAGKGAVGRWLFTNGKRTVLQHGGKDAFLVQNVHDPVARARYWEKIRSVFYIQGQFG